MSGPWQPTRPDRPADVTVTIVELVVCGLGALLAAFLGLFLAFVSDSCDSTCDDGRIGGGIALAVVAPLVLYAVALVWSIVRMRRRKISFWVPLLAAAVWVPCFVGAALLATSGVPD